MSRAFDAGPKTGSQEVLEVVLAADPSAEPKDLRGRRERVELDVVARAVPDVARPAQELVRLVAALAVDAERVEREGDHADLRVVRIDVHHREHNVREIIRTLGVS